MLLRIRGRGRFVKLFFSFFGVQKAFNARKYFVRDVQFFWSYRCVPPDSVLEIILLIFFQSRALKFLIKIKFHVINTNASCHVTCHAHPLTSTTRLDKKGYATLRDLISLGLPLVVCSAEDCVFRRFVSLSTFC